MRFLDALMVAVLLLLLSGFGYAVAPPGPKGDEKADMVLIPAGDFLMGSPESRAYPTEENPQHTVYVDAFYMDAYEVTNEEFAEFLSAVKSGADFEKHRENWVVIRNDIEKEEKSDWWPTEIELDNGSYRAVPGFERYPVLSVSWYAADAYCRRAGKRLPTEAEWEKAARGGLEKMQYPWGNEVPTGGVVFKRSWQDNAYPAPAGEVGNYYANGYGIYDMSGNVSEWCSDWYAADYYRSSPLRNPRGPESGLLKVIRGGSWMNTAAFLRVACRSKGSPESMNSGLGFRCAQIGK
jgi:formylglycine-generating enzyme required for sulfatase activity